MTNSQKIEAILRHMKMVESHMQRLAKYYVDTDLHFALELLKRSREHDLSKFNQFEFVHLHKGDERFKEALALHRKNNSHHPECKGIHAMAKIDIAEMVCDCFARSQEFGADIKQWFYQEWMPKYNVKSDSLIAKWIEEYLHLLLTETFSSNSL